jgi:hypothetical protein
MPSDEVFDLIGLLFGVLALVALAYFAYELLF